MPNNPSATVQSIVDAIRSQIRSGRLRIGSQLPTEYDLANRYSVSRGTVRRAIDVLLDAGELTRKPHSRPIVERPASRDDSHSGTDVLVWISRKIADMPSLQFLKGVSQGLAGSGRRLIVREPTRFVDEVVECEEREFLLDLLHNESAAGAIIERDPFRSNQDLLAQLQEGGKHLVFVDTPPPEGIEADHVGTANTSAARRCVEHLIELGHTRIACVVDIATPRPTQDRVKGYWRAMQHAGLESEGRFIDAHQLPPYDNLRPLTIGGPYALRLAQNPYFVSFAQRAVAEILAMEPMPTALFAGYDVFAYWVCAFLEGSGVRVPADMSVVGFDWQAREESPALDTLTTANQDFYGFGRHAVDLLLDRFADGGSPSPRHVLLDAPLIVRSSTAARLILPDAMPAHHALDGAAR